MVDEDFEVPKVLEKRPLGINIIILVGAVFTILQLYSVAITRWEILYLSLFDFIEIILTMTALVGLWLMRKWGAALTVIVLSIGVAKMLEILQTIFSSFEGRIETVIRVNQILAFIMLVYDVIALFYLFNKIFRGIFH